MNREEATRDVLNLENLHMVNKQKFVKIINKIYDDFESRTCDLEITSNENGYIPELAWHGRVKPNTVYRMYVEEVKDKK